MNYADAQRQEQVTFDELDSNLQDIIKQIESYDVGGGNRPTPDPTANWDKTKVDPVTSADNIVVPVPKGFVASKATGENTVENGFVIYQGTDDVTDANKETAMTTRNQFVWIPVDLKKNPMFAKNGEKDIGQLYNFDRDTKTYSAMNTEEQWQNEGYREPDVVTGNGSQYDAVTSNYASLGLTNKAGEAVDTLDEFRALLEEDFAEMKASIEKYHGFYIGRYETGAGEKVVKGVNPLVNKTWYELYETNRNMINSNGIKSSMIWGSQWDQTMIWFDTQGGAKKDYVYNSDGKGHYDASSTTTTGSNTDYAVNNIYDMAGNADDWTIEASYTNHRVFRGGNNDYSGSSNPASYRNYDAPSSSYGGFGSRVTIIM